MAYPLLLAAAREVNESVKLSLLTANVQQISICHRGLQTANGFPFFPRSKTLEFHLFPTHTAFVIVPFYLPEVLLDGKG